MGPALHFQLRQRMGESRADHRGFLVVEFFGQAGFGAFAGFLGFRFVDVFTP